MGMFDDIPVGPEKQSGGGMFSDIAAKPPVRQPSFSSIAEQAGVGVYGAATGLAGLPGDIGRGAAATRAAFGGLPDISFASALSVLPGQKQIQTMLEPITGPIPPAQNWMEEYARTFGEFSPMGLGGGAAALTRRIGRVLVPSVFAESAKQGAKELGLSEQTQEWAKFAGAITPSTLSYLWRTAPERMEGAMDQLYRFARENYEHPDVKTLEIKLPVVQREAFTIADDLFNNYGMREGPVADAINELALPQEVKKVKFPPSVGEPELRKVLGMTPEPSKSSITYADISSVRNRLSAISGNFLAPHDQELAIVAKAKIDKWMAGLSQDDLVVGDAAKSTARLADARSDWWAAKSLEDLGTKLYQGTRRGATSYSGQNLENAVRQRIADILIREKKTPTGQFTPKEIDLLERASTPKGLEQLARRVSKIFPRHGVMAPIIGTIVGTATGHPYAGPLTGLAVGEAAHTLENKLVNRLVRDVQEQVLSRAASRSKVRLPDERIDILSPAILGRPQGEGQGGGQTLSFDSLGNLVTSAEAKQAPVLGQLPEAAARVERERKRREAEVE